ncbi:TIGR04222 domain-containing membrane protein, partial [Streptomyces sp. NPDC005899]|uniref:TIGR04222 domain-containing membrane protein n=1 Tax=Streptomyces sp. NPDC005899 TaxID=3155716 RepID=UPI0033FF7E91
PAGQAGFAPLRAGAAAADAVGGLPHRIDAAGLAVPHGTRNGLESAVRAVRGAAVLVVALAAAAMLMPGQETGYAGPVAAWFGLPLVLTLGCLAISRVESHPYSPWASPSGQRWLDSLPAPVRGADRDLLAAVAVRGVDALQDPELRAALRGGRPAHPVR